jgi:CBS-domain-containing membrane protein
LAVQQKPASGKGSGRGRKKGSKNRRTKEREAASTSSTANNSGTDEPPAKRGRVLHVNDGDGGPDESTHITNGEQQRAIEAIFEQLMGANDEQRQRRQAASASLAARQIVTPDERQRQEEARAQLHKEPMDVRRSAVMRDEVRLFGDDEARDGYEQDDQLPFRVGVDGSQTDWQQHSLPATTEELEYRVAVLERTLPDLTAHWDMQVVSAIDRKRRLLGAQQQTTRDVVEIMQAR